ncbi:hypothetical protein K1T71_015188 [Dendrolimus kikuchii]|nr:hypothetical protein K1T71_015188 [Dendrolimus kikuchii]
MSKKLDNASSRQWEEYRNTLEGNNSPSLQQFLKFLNNRADLLDTVQEQNVQASQSNNTKGFIVTSNNITSTYKNKPNYTKNPMCPMCSDSHFLFACPTFKTLSVDLRIKKVTEARVCKNCLRPGHIDKNCRLSHCKYCQLKHNTLLHKEVGSETRPPPSLENNVALSSNIALPSSNRGLVLLSTALVKVRDIHGHPHAVRLLLDNGSTSNFVTQHLCEKLGLVRRNTSSTVSGRGARLLKCYICIFVCLATKAVHLEVATDLTTEAFIGCLNRFVARRGMPQTVYSDNGTNFVGACNQLSSFLKRTSSTLSSEAAMKGICFKFIPAYAPAWGGLWESAVKSVKHHLRRILGLSHLTYEELATCLAQIEAILNSRPLVPLSSDPCDLSYLTPSHFLIGRSLTSIPQADIEINNINSLQRFQRVQKLKQHFWNRFSKEYVSCLQQKTRWRASLGALRVGEMVLVEEPNTPPLLWLVGRIVRVMPGQDGVARMAEIKTKKGLLIRTAHRLCPLNI